MIWEIYNKLIADTEIVRLVGNNIKFYDYPEAKDLKETHIIIDSLNPPKPGDFADDIWLTDDFMFQIDVWSNDMTERDTVASKIQEIMWQLNFRQMGGLDEYDKDYDIYRDARRYRGKAYRKEFKKL